MDPIPDGKVIELFKIPSGTTGQVQPLDKAFFRQWKTLYRQLSEKLCSNSGIKFEVYQRNNILKLQSFVHYQFCSPRFHNLIKYAWFATRYVTQRPLPFVTPAEYCLRTNNNTCELVECGDKSVVRCGWCKVCLCVDHSINNSHFCNSYVE